MTDTQGEPIIGATVLVKGTGIGTATDIDGKFSLDIPSNGKTLVVSFIGFDAQEIPVTNNATYKNTVKRNRLCSGRGSGDGFRYEA